MTKTKRRAPSRPVTVIRPRRRDRVKVALAILIPLAVTAGVGTAIALNSGSSGSSSQANGTTTTTLSQKQSAEQTQTQAWQGRINNDFNQVANDLVQLIKQTDSWRTGSANSAQITALVDTDFPNFVSARDVLAKEAPFPPAPIALNHFQMASVLYVEALRVERVAVGGSPGPLPTQLDLSFRRLRELADRVYDQGTRALEPTLHQPTTGPDFQMVKSPDVPDWLAEGLAAGPPLDATPPPASKAPPVYQQNRPQQSMSGWVRAVQRLGIPSAGELAAAVMSGDGSLLQQLSNRFVSAANALNATPDPQGQREIGTTVRLGVLVDAESARVAQAATLVTDAVQRSRLTDVSRRLALIGDGMWHPALGSRQSGFNPDLLTQTGP